MLGLTFCVNVTGVVRAIHDLLGLLRTEHIVQKQIQVVVTLDQRELELGLILGFFTFIVNLLL